mmetsp:Transcript_82399/g.255799  ORF Transcript_82399/g.255799 Transcript_82399/m.255799 type:complete len:253 (-) Transcript_82399:113-871(-)
MLETACSAVLTHLLDLDPATGGELLLLLSGCFLTLLLGFAHSSGCLLGKLLDEDLHGLGHAEEQAALLRRPRPAAERALHFLLPRRVQAPLLRPGFPDHWRAFVAREARSIGEVTDGDAALSPLCTSVKVCTHPLVCEACLEAEVEGESRFTTHLECRGIPLYLLNACHRNDAVPNLDAWSLADACLDQFVRKLLALCFCVSKAVCLTGRFLRIVDVLSAVCLCRKPLLQLLREFFPLALSCRDLRVRLFIV